MALENNWGEVGGKGAGAAGREGWPGGGGHGLVGRATTPPVEEGLGACRKKKTTKELRVWRVRACTGWPNKDQG
jgi:hypothetical protein